MKTMQKKRHILLMLLTVFCLTTKSQNFIDTTKIWNVYACNGAFFNSCITQTYKFNSDTIIGSKKYYKLSYSNDSIPINWYSLGRFNEDTISKKVYWRQSNQDMLLYDFNLNVGDTAKVLTSFGNNYCTAMVVDSIRFNNYMGVSRKQWYFNTQFFYGQQETWIAGIGNLFGPAENLSFVCLADYGPRLICYKENTILKYIDTVINDCYKTTVGIKANENNKLNINIYPNPTQKSFTIQTNNSFKKHITIKNELGQTIIQTISSDKSILIDFYQTGVFYVTVTQDKSTWTGKLIKN